MSDATATSPALGRPWAAIIALYLLTQIVLLAAAFGWVFVYSAFINSSGDGAFYQAYAQRASPVVAVVLSGPVFFVAGLYLRRYRERAVQAAFTLVAINVAIDIAIVTTMAIDVPYNALMSVLSAALKLAGAYYGARSAARES